MKQETKHCPSSKPIWIAVSVLYFVYVSLWGIVIYASWRGYPLP